AFLALFWATAPLALLYAIPYERFLGEMDAARANLLTLGLVAAWRVVLTARVASGWVGVQFYWAFIIVMLFSVPASIVGEGLSPQPVVSLMSGAKLSATEALISNTVFFATVVGSLSMPVWTLGAIAALFGAKPRGGAIMHCPIDARRVPVPSGVAVISIVIWLPILPFTQREQSRRYAVERHLRENRIAEGLALMSKHAPSDFPPGFDPPPRPRLRNNTPDIIDVAETLSAGDFA